MSNREPDESHNAFYSRELAMRWESLKFLLYLEAKRMLDPTLNWLCRIMEKFQSK